MKQIKVLLALIYIILPLINAAIQFRVVHEWNYLNYTWESEDALEKASANGLYIPEHNIAAGIAYHDHFVYMAVPRSRNGVPATLARFNSTDRSVAPLLQPYPSWGMNTPFDCNAFQNVKDIQLDNKGNLWILDAGRVFGIDHCTPKLVIYDIQRNETLVKYNFPTHIINPQSNLLHKFVVDDANGGFAYITNMEKDSPSLIVFKLDTMESWRINHVTFRGVEDATNFSINNVNVQETLNVAGIALGKKLNAMGDRIVYYTSISTFHLYQINTNILKNQYLSQYDFGEHVRDVGLKKSQTDGMIMDNKGVLYYGLLDSTSIARWNTSQSFETNQKTIARDADLVQWVNSFAFDNTGGLFTLTSQYYNFLNNRMSLNEVNIRLLFAYVASLNSISDQFDDHSTTTTTSSTTTTEDNHIHFHLVTSTVITPNISLMDDAKMHDEHHHQHTNSAYAIANSCIALLHCLSLLFTIIVM